MNCSTCWMQVFLLISPFVVAATEHEAAPNIVGETIGQVAARTGYTIKDLKEDFPAIDGWSELGIKLDPERLATSYAKDRFKAPQFPAYILAFTSTRKICRRSVSGSKARESHGRSGT